MITKTPSLPAGANLVLGIISHISHPHPQIPPLHLSAPFKGILLLTPWVSFESSVSSSGERCKNRDIVNPEIASKWSSAFLGERKRDAYNEPLTAKAAWWEGLKAEEILLVASEDECLTDDVAKMGEILKVSDFFISFFLFIPLWEGIYTYLLSPPFCFCARARARALALANLFYFTVGTLKHNHHPSER